MARSRAGIAAQPDFDALKKFSELTDREDTPFFGGRTDEIATVENALKRIQRRTQEDHWHPAGGETVLFQGAPGAGKSALLYYLAKVWRSSGQNAPVVVDTESTHYVDERRLALRIAEAADPALSARLGHSAAGRSGSRADISNDIPGSVTGSGSAESGHQAVKAPVELSLDTVKEALTESKRPVVLILDEAQDLESFSVETVLPVISRLHTGNHGGPFLTVLAGLAYSSGVLREAALRAFPKAMKLRSLRLHPKKQRKLYFACSPNSECAETRNSGANGRKPSPKRVAAGRSTFMSPCRHSRRSFLQQQHPEVWSRSTANSDPKCLRPQLRRENNITSDGSTRNSSSLWI